MSKKEHIKVILSSILGVEPEVTYQFGLPSTDFWKSKSVTLDIEHSDQNPYLGGSIQLIGLVNSDSDNVYIILPNEFDNLKTMIKEYSGIIIGHQVSGDMVWLTKYGFKFHKDIKIYDTMIYEKVLPDAPERGFSLKYLAKKYFKVKAWESEIHGHWHNGTTPTLDSLAKYCAQDCIATKSLFEKQQSDFRNLRTFELAMRYEFPMIQLMHNGIYVNPDELNKLDTQCKATILKLRQEIQEIVGVPVIFADDDDDEQEEQDGR